MNRARFLAAMVFLTIAVSAVPSLAEISLVADLDSNYANGPDTLLIEPMDTVLVRIWITGEDSLIGFGMTIGDTTGALTWVEDSASAVYTTPAPWYTVEVIQDSAGWLLLQGSDFGGSATIALPFEVANLRFVVTPGDSCGTLGWDENMSGWQNTVTDADGFQSMQTVLICVDGQAFAGDGGEMDGESGSDGSGTSDSGEPGTVNGSDTGGYEDTSESTPSSFTRQFEISTNDYLFVHGHRLLGLVECKWQKGHPLSVNGYQVLPAPSAQERDRPESYYVEKYSQVPLVANLVSSGVTWEGAASAWMDTLRNTSVKIGALFELALRETGSLQNARGVVEDAVRDLPDSLVDHTEQVKWRGSLFMIPWKGRRVNVWWEPSQPTPASNSGPLMPSYWKALTLVTNMRDLLRAPGPSIFVWPSKGGPRGYAATDASESTNLDEVMEQLLESTISNQAPGKLPAYAVREILEAGGINQ